MWTKQIEYNSWRICLANVECAVVYSHTHTPSAQIKKYHNKLYHVRARARSVGWNESLRQQSCVNHEAICTTWASGTSILCVFALKYTYISISIVNSARFPLISIKSYQIEYQKIVPLHENWIERVSPPPSPRLPPHFVRHNVGSSSSQQLRYIHIY